jgi:hypothetical protein
MTGRRLIPLAMFRALRPLFRVPGTAQVIEFAGFVTGVTGVTGFYAPTRARVQSHMRAHAGMRSRGRAHPVTPVTK